MTTSSGILGWDIGGVNTKVARLAGDPQALLRTVSLRFAVQHQAETLATILKAAAARVENQPGDVHAVTMTAELSQAFRTKREGVGFVLDALSTAFPDSAVQVYTVAD